ncbi:hypothetical protein KCP74_13905 [Salmonella enterica subsp. enterica]|nr:hypothetical protein KCP74_13905 [Salmonella enterica subsp. enterica]
MPRWWRVCVKSAGGFLADARLLDESRCGMRLNWLTPMPPLSQMVEECHRRSSMKAIAGKTQRACGDDGYQRRSTMVLR